MVKTTLPLIWSSNAVWRLNRIYYWYSTHETIRRARKVIISIKTTARKIPLNPYKHPQCFEVKTPTPNIRRALVSKTYWIVFEIEENRIVILEIIHGAIDPDNYTNI
jgi:plasmid stabilization system protein ParE